MERKLLFFDIDGTLAMPGFKVSPAVTNAIRTARSNGHLAFISTGRPKWLVPDYITDIGFDGGIFHAGGRVLVDNASIYDQYMPQSLTREMLECLRTVKGMYFILECAENCYRCDPTPFFDAIDSVNEETAGTELRRLMQDLMNPDHLDVDTYQGEGVYKISFFTTDKRMMEETVEKLSPIGKAVWFENLSAGYPMFAGEVSAFGVDKGTALNAVCRYLGAERKDCIAFGDSMNDAEIIVAAGEGIAMGNAEGRLKALADRCCESVVEDGIAKELHRLGLC